MTTNSPFLFTKIINNKSRNDHATDLTYSIHQKRPIKYTFKIVILRMTTLDNSIYMRCQFVLHSKILNERIFLLKFSQFLSRTLCQLLYSVLYIAFLCDKEMNEQNNNKSCLAGRKNWEYEKKSLVIPAATCCQDNGNVGIEPLFIICEFLSNNSLN